MDYFDILRELRRGEPDIDKTAKALKVLGWLSVAGGLWNFGFYYLAPLEKFSIKLPPNFPHIALIALAALGGLYLYASRAVKDRNPWGRTVGQTAIVLSLALIAGFAWFAFHQFEMPRGMEEIPNLFGIVMLVVLAQFALPAYFGVRYLSRLPIAEDARAAVFKPPASQTNAPPIPGAERRYKDALLPFGVFGTFLLLLAVPFAMFFLVGKLGDARRLTLMPLPMFIFVFCAPIAYNYWASPFEADRKVQASFTGGGSIFLFSGTWPFFRLLVYADGLEVRVMFHRFFIPYDQMGELPAKIGFFSRGLLIKSNLPGVPAGIRYQGFGMQKVLDVIRQHQGQRPPRT